MSHYFNVQAQRVTSLTGDSQNSAVPRFFSPPELFVVRRTWLVCHHSQGSNSARSDRALLPMAEVISRNISQMKAQGSGLCPRIYGPRFLFMVKEERAALTIEPLAPSTMQPYPEHQNRQERCAARSLDRALKNMTWIGKTRNVAQMRDWVAMMILTAMP